RLSGQLLAEVDQARINFEAAFVAWRNGGQGPQYLLRGKDLRLVERHEAQIPWGADAQKKQDFLSQSRRRRRGFRLGLAAAVVALVIAGWFGLRQFDRYEATQYLKEYRYPPELYDWQHQLQVLKLHTPFNLERFRWLHSGTVEEVHLNAATNSHSISGLT